MNFLLSVAGTINDYLWSYILIGLLITLGLFFTFRSGFAQARLLGDMIGLITGRLTTLKDNEKRAVGQVTGFQAFCISVASHVGTGNLAGIAIAISIGGPGAVFWMWLIALLGGATSLVENTLAQVYKVKNDDGSFRGGPSYYMEKALGMKGLGAIFSVIVIVTFAIIFNTVQANTITSALQGSFGLNLYIGGAIVTVLTAVVIFGGTERIANVSGVIVPVMAVAYIIVAIVVLVLNITELPRLFMSIVENAFGIQQAVGGGLGVVVLQGVKRGLYSNEAGMGSAPNAAAISNVSHPVKQGLLQAFGVFVDTILVCSATAFIVLLYPDYQAAYAQGFEGIQLTQMALAHSVGAWGIHFVTFCIFLFAFSSVIGNYYYGETNLGYISKNKTSLFIFRVFVLIAVYIGSVAKLGTVWNMADLFMGIMALINIIVITILSPIAIAVIKDYMKQRKEGKNPTFKAKSISGLKNTECWDD